MRLRFVSVLLAVLIAGLLSASLATAAHVAPSWTAEQNGGEAQYAPFPKPVGAYGDSGLSTGERIKNRTQAEPFNVVATVIFACAVLHTFFAGRILVLAHRVEKKHLEKIRQRGRTAADKNFHGAKDDVSFAATVLEFLGEVETVFALWALPLLGAAVCYFGWDHARSFVALDSNFTEPMFVVIIMAIAASRPVVQFAEKCLSVLAGWGKGTPAAWWLTVLIVAPLLGSLITEPAAMTISALLLGRKFYELRPSSTFKYATLGLLFVNVSVGGVLTNFAAPPVLMVAGPERWNWSSLHMLEHFGWKSVSAILLSSGLYFLVFRRHFPQLAQTVVAESDSPTRLDWVDRHDPVPPVVTIVHLAALAWTVLTSHYPPLFVGGFLFFLAFVRATGHHQNEIQLRGPLMVGLFLSGLVLHGRMQGWWLEPLLSSNPSDWALHGGAAILTGFNDNALITFLASQVPHLDPAAKFAIMSGAVAGGGLTVIANAPNPAGQNLLKRYFPEGVSPLGLLLAALVPTLITVACFMLTPR